MLQSHLCAFTSTVDDSCVLCCNGRGGDRDCVRGGGGGNGGGGVGLTFRLRGLQMHVQEVTVATASDIL